jgi:hypothetical protein
MQQLHATAACNSRMQQLHATAAAVMDDMGHDTWPHMCCGGGGGG